MLSKLPGKGFHESISSDLTSATSILKSPRISHQLPAYPVSSSQACFPLPVFMPWSLCCLLFSIPPPPNALLPLSSCYLSADQSLGPHIPHQRKLQMWILSQVLNGVLTSESSGASYENNDYKILPPSHYWDLTQSLAGKGAWSSLALFLRWCFLLFWKTFRSLSPSWVTALPTSVSFYGEGLLI